MKENLSLQGIAIPWRNEEAHHDAHGVVEARCEDGKINRCLRIWPWPPKVDDTYT
ncbi:MAG: hypothetical protein GY914_10735 [Prochlorococcus sp.]|nr:hypothetical protein [Prochlorococcus sp.]